jgi:hypothetical protein
MRGAGFLAAALAVAAGSAQAQPSAPPPAPSARVWNDGVVEIRLGHRVTVRIPEDGGNPEIVSVAPAQASEAAPPKPGQGTFADPPAGLVAFVATRDGGQVRLKIESGVSRAFDYGARLAGDVPPDQVFEFPVKACTVLPLLSAFEAWPQPAIAATAVRLHDFRFRDMNEVVCADPTPYPRLKDPVQKQP